MRIASEQHLQPVHSAMQPAFGAVAGLANGHAATAQPRLVKAAHEFEAQLMKELMKPLTSGATPGDADDEDEDGGTGLGAGLGSAGALGEYASESLAQALSLQGGFGIADKIIKQLSHRNLSHEGNETESVRAAGNEREKVKIKPLK
jgi:Rod binding domain-containing protein